MRSPVFALLSSLFLAAALAAPIFGQNPADLPKSDVPNANPARIDKTPPAADAIPAAVDPNKYVIGAEDILMVTVWREPDFTGTRVVRPDGKISMPLIGEIQASGLTPEQLGKNLTGALNKYVNKPDVLVSLQQVNSKKYYIDGGVNRPGEYRLVTPTTILEALSQAGGFREFSNTKKIRILRGDKTLKFNYKEVSHGKKMDQNIYVENGDHIIVPE